MLTGHFTFTFYFINKPINSSVYVRCCIKART